MGASFNRRIITKLYDKDDGTLTKMFLYFVVSFPRSSIIQIEFTVLTWEIYFHATKNLIIVVSAVNSSTNPVRDDSLIQRKERTILLAPGTERGRAAALTQ